MSTTAGTMDSNEYNALSPEDKLQVDKNTATTDFASEEEAGDASNVEAAEQSIVLETERADLDLSVEKYAEAFPVIKS